MQALYLTVVTLFSGCPVTQIFVHPTTEDNDLPDEVSPDPVSAVSVEEPSLPEPSAPAALERITLPQPDPMPSIMLDRFALPLGAAAQLVFNQSSRERAQQAQLLLDSAREVNLAPYLWAIEAMLMACKLPDKTGMVLADHPALAEVANEAMNAARGSRAWKFWKGLQEVVRQKIKQVLHDTRPFRPASNGSGYHGSHHNGQTGKTGRNGLSRAQRDARRAANHAARAAISQGMRSPKGKGKK